jgi:putative ABC transport system substrate-binding protein
MGIRIIGLIVTIVLGLLAVPLAAEAQQAKKVFRVGYLYAGSSSFSAPVHVAFVQGLRDLGYVEGQNVIIEHRKANGQADRLPGLAAELAHLKVDVIVTPGPEATLRAASQATRTIPIVAMAANYNPIAKGYIDSLARPGGNITGVFFMQLALTTKRLDLLKKALPQVTRVFALYDVHSADQLQATEAAAQSLGLQLQSLELRNPPYDFESAMAAAVLAHAEALMVLSSPVFYAQRTEVAESTVKHRLPAMFLFGFYAQAGGLMSYGVNIADMFRYAATYVDKIIKGANPADLPVEQPTKFEFVVNLKTAKVLGITIPPIVLYQATKVIR